MTKRKRKNNKTFLLIPFSLILIILGIFLYKSVNAPFVSVVDVYKTRESTTTNYSNAPIVELSKAWESGAKTYSNPNVGITFEYPSSFEVHQGFQSENNNSSGQPLYKIDLFTRLSTPQGNRDSENFCRNNMFVLIQRFDNPQKTTLYDVITDLNMPSYGGDEMRTIFEKYKNDLTISDLPKPNSYVYEGNYVESPKKEVFFAHDDKVYVFELIGGCDTAGQYTPEAEAIFDKIIQSIKFK